MKNHASSCSRIPHGLMLAFALLLAPALVAQVAQPSFDQLIEPATIGPASVSTLRFDISNGASSPAVDMAFTNGLPAGVTLASPANAASTCGGILSAPDGSSTIGFAGGSIGASESCEITVDITASTAGTHTNISGDLTSSLGNSGNSTADLTVATDRPGFTKGFSPSSVFIGGRSTLTLTIDNSANASAATNLRVIDSLPAGIVVADPPHGSTTCDGGILTATAGSGSIQYQPQFSNDAAVAANSTCTITVDVLANAVGTLVNSTDDLTSTTAFGGAARSSGKANASLIVEFESIAFSKLFVDDPAAPGDEVTLEFMIRNLDRGFSATQIAFTDDLDAVLPGLVATGLPILDPCGQGSTLAGTSFLTLNGGQLASEATCTFSVTLTIPATTQSATYTNTTSLITAEVGGSSVTGNAAVDMLFVQPTPRLSKSFVDDPVGAGGSVELEFSITNTSAISSATEIFFEDIFVSELPTASLIPLDGFCGTGSVATYTPRIDPGSGSTPAKLVVSGANLAPGATCTFSLVLDVSVDAALGTYANITSPITAMVDGETLIGQPATDDLIVVAAPRLTKEFIDDPVVPGDVVTLRFILEHGENAPSDASVITFSDDLAANLSGLEAIGLPLADPCGSGSLLEGTSTLLFTGGSLTPGETCIFSVSLQVPATAPAGSHTNTTSTVVATVEGVTAGSNAASNDLVVAGLQLGKEFIDDPALPGGVVTLRYTIENTSPVSHASDILFLDNLDDALDNLSATGVPITDPCGPGSTLLGSAGNTLLNFEGGSLATGATCTFDVTLAIPANAAEGTYASATSQFQAMIDGSIVAFDNASDELTIVRDLLSLAKEFVDDPVPPGASITLRFTLTNLSPDSAISSIEFADDLEAALAGLESTSGTLADLCGPGSSIFGTDELIFTTGSLAAGATCSFDVSLAVPTNAPIGTIATNITSPVSGDLGGVLVTGDPAIDELRIDALTFEKAFDGDATAGSTVGLTFTIENLSSGDTAIELTFLDDLDAMIPGLEAIGLPRANVCGAGSVIDGVSTVSLLGGNLLPVGSCTFTIDLQVPLATAPGDYLNITTQLRQFGIPAAMPAEATLTVLGTSDTDQDGVLDENDLCPGTVIPEGVPTVSLGVNRYALIDDDFIFDTRSPPGGGGGPGDVFTTTNTGGCSCEQIIAAMGLGNGHTKFGCSIGAMRTWINAATPASAWISYDGFEDGDFGIWTFHID